MSVAHVAFNFRLRYQSGHTIYHHGIYCSTANQLFSDVQCLLGAIWLRYEKVIKIETTVGCVDGVKGVLNVDVGCDSAELLGFSHYVDG